MAVWNSGHTLVLRGSDDSDPTAPGYEEIEIGFADLDVDPVPEGETLKDADYAVRGKKQRRYVITVSTKPFYRRNAQGARFQTHGDYRKLIRVLYSYEHQWIYRVYESGSTAGTYYEFADESGTDTFFNLTTDTPAGICPWKVEPLGEPSKSPTESGVFDAEIMLQAKTLI